MIVDAHAHLGDSAAFYLPDLSLETWLAYMDAVGIDRSLNMPTASLWQCFEEGYAASVAAFEESSGRVLFAMAYDPHYVQDSLTWASKALDHPGGVAIRIHPVQDEVWPEDRLYEPVWQLAAERDVPIITHSWALSDYHPQQRFATPDHFEYYVARYPQVKLILGHAGGRYEGHLAAADLAQRHPNVYMDISGDVYPFGFIEWIVAQVGADRILFGSDVNWIDARTIIGRGTGR